MNKLLNYVFLKINNTPLLKWYYDRSVNFNSLLENTEKIIGSFVLLNTVVGMSEFDKNRLKNRLSDHLSCIHGIDNDDFYKSIFIFTEQELEYRLLNVWFPLYRTGYFIHVKEYEYDPDKEYTGSGVLKDDINYKELLGCVKKLLGIEE